MASITLVRNPLDITSYEHFNFTGRLIDFLQDINSWVFMPLAVSFAISEDGEHFAGVGRIEATTPPDKWGAVIEPFSVAFTPTRAHYVRVAAVSRKTCPTWHKGSGGPSWIFADEIAVR